MSRIGAIALRDAVLDDGSLHSWDTQPPQIATTDSYRRDLSPCGVVMCGFFARLDRSGGR